MCVQKVQRGITQQLLQITIFLINQQNHYTNIDAFKALSLNDQQRKFIKCCISVVFEKLKNVTELKVSDSTATPYSCFSATL